MAEYESDYDFRHETAESLSSEALHFLAAVTSVYAGRLIMLIFSCQSVYLVYKV